MRLSSQNTLSNAVHTLKVSSTFKNTLRVSPGPLSADFRKLSPECFDGHCAPLKSYCQPMNPSHSRQEYRPWTGVRPAKSARRNPPTGYSSPGTEATNVQRETSYQAAYSGEAQRSTGLHQGENVISSASTNVQPAAVSQHIPSLMRPSGLQQSVPPDRMELSGTRAEVGHSSSVHRVHRVH